MDYAKVKTVKQLRLSENIKILRVTLAQHPSTARLLIMFPYDKLPAILVSTDQRTQVLVDDDKKFIYPTLAILGVYSESDVMAVLKNPIVEFPNGLEVDRAKRMYPSWFGPGMYSTFVYTGPGCKYHVPEIRSLRQDEHGRFHILRRLDKLNDSTILELGHEVPEDDLLRNYRWHGGGVRGEREKIAFHDKHYLTE